MVSLYCANELSIHQVAGTTGIVLDLINFSAEALSFFTSDNTSGINWLGGACYDGNTHNGNNYIANVSFGLEYNISSSTGFTGPKPLTQFVACKFVDNCQMEADTSQFLNVRFTACDMPLLTIVGSGCVVDLDSISYPTGGAPALVSGGTFTLRTPATAGLYAPAAPGDWAATPPADVQDALDRLAAVAVTPP